MYKATLTVKMPKLFWDSDILSNLAKKYGLVYTEIYRECGFWYRTIRFSYEGADTNTILKAIENLEDLAN